MAEAASHAAWSRSGFYSSVIKEDGSDEREHSEMLLRTLVRPAVSAVDQTLEVVRSDELPTNCISTSVDEHVLKSRLLVADLSYLSENVLLEVGARRAIGRPYVLISRLADKPHLPSNLRDERVLFLDTHFGRYEVRLEGYIRELSGRIQRALSPTGHREHPIRSRFPDFRDYIE